MQHICFLCFIGGIMLLVPSYEYFLNLLSNRYGEAERIVCILLLDPANDDSISGYVTRRFDYFNYRLGERLDFFCPGFSRAEDRGAERDFNPKDFVEFVQQLEKLTTWRYYGGTNLLLLRYSDYELHFDSVYDLNFSRMIIDGFITDYRYFFEDLIRALKADDASFFDRQCAKQQISRFWNNFSDLLPNVCKSIVKHIKDTIKIDEYFTPKDIRKW